MTNHHTEKFLQSKWCSFILLNNSNFVRLGLNGFAFNIPSNYNFTHLHYNQIGYARYRLGFVANATTLKLIRIHMMVNQIYGINGFIFSPVHRYALYLSNTKSVKHILIFQSHPSNYNIAHAIYSSQAKTILFKLCMKSFDKPWVHMQIATELNICLYMAHQFSVVRAVSMWDSFLYKPKCKKARIHSAKIRKQVYNQKYIRWFKKRKRNIANTKIKHRIRATALYFTHSINSILIQERKSSERKINMLDMRLYSKLNEL